MMATKNGTKKLFKEKTFQLEQLPGCCGVGVISYFKDEEPTYDYSRGWTPKRTAPRNKYETKEEQAEACYKKFIEQTWDEDDAYDDNAYSYLMITLVSNYDKPMNGFKAGDHQYPEMEEILLREGWNINQVFINPNHGNEVTVYSKYFPERDKLLHDEDGDDNWGEDDEDEE
jgi:hypothetical protein